MAVLLGMVLLVPALMHLPAAPALSAPIEETHIGPWVQTAALIEPGASLGPSDDLGSAVTVSGDMALVGAPGAASAYIYERQGPVWTRGVHFDGGTGFGRSVALDGSTAVVGGEGEAAILERAGGVWSRAATLSDGSAKGFGVSVAVSGDLVAVGDTGSPPTVTVYERGSGSWDAVWGRTCDDCGQFGQSVSIDKNTLAVDAPPIATHVFERSDGGWTQAAELHGPSSFGRSLALGGDLMAVGAATEDLVSVFAREGGTWALATELKPPEDLVDRPAFGSSVDIAEDAGVVVVGAKWDDVTPSGTPPSPTEPPVIEGVGVPDPGAVHVFAPAGGGWEHVAKLSPTGPVWGEQFGTSVAVNGDASAIVAGAPYNKRGPTWVLDFLDVPHDQHDMAFVFEEAVGR